MSMTGFAIFLSAGLLAPLVPVAPLSQEEVDRLVDSDVLACLHQEDFDDAQAALRVRGATDAMLAHGYYVALDKTKDAPVGSPAAERFQGALHGFAAVASACQLTNLLLVATSATNQHSVADAVLACHRRDPLSRELLDWCMDRACADNGQELVKATVWNCIRNTLKDDRVLPAMRVRLLETARKGLLSDIRSVFAADRILEENDSAYAQSALRKMALRRVADMEGLSSDGAMRSYFDAKTKAVNAR